MHPVIGGGHLFKLKRSSWFASTSAVPLVLVVRSLLLVPFVPAVAPRGRETSVVPRLEHPRESRHQEVRGRCRRFASRPKRTSTRVVMSIQRARNTTTREPRRVPYSPAYPTAVAARDRPSQARPKEVSARCQARSAERENAGSRTCSAWSKWRVPSSV